MDKYTLMVDNKISRGHVVLREIILEPTSHQHRFDTLSRSEPNFSVTKRESGCVNATGRNQLIWDDNESRTIPKKSSD